VRTVKTVIQTSDRGRVLVVDHGDIGIAVVSQELMRGVKRHKWVSNEECLISRDDWPEVMKTLSELLGVGK
jgi:hypothetical protein